MTPRYCPLCDAKRTERWCPRHQVPTLPSSATAPPAAKIVAGTILSSRYRVDALLGRGGMGAILTGTDLEEGGPVVLKVLRGGKIRERGRLRRFFTEGRTASQLDHPNIIKVHGLAVDEATRAPFLIMERALGETLERVMNRVGPFSEARVGWVALQIAQALGAAHAQGVLHRDLKPSNVMLHDRPGRPDFVTVLDFGLAKLLEPNDGLPPLTAPGRSVGTPAFMSPEQVTQGPQDGRSDFYGLGCLLHYLLTGRPPYEASQPSEMMRMHLQAPIPRLPERLSDGQAPTSGLIRMHRALLAKDPKDRPQDITAALEVLADEPIETLLLSGLPKTEASEPGGPNSLDDGPRTEKLAPVDDTLMLQTIRNTPVAPPLPTPVAALEPRPRPLDLGFAVPLSVGISLGLAVLVLALMFLVD